MNNLQQGVCGTIENLDLQFTVRQINWLYQYLCLFRFPFIVWFCVFLTYLFFGEEVREVVGFNYKLTEDPPEFELKCVVYFSIRSFFGEKSDLAVNDRPSVEV